MGKKVNIWGNGDKGCEVFPKERAPKKTKGGCSKKKRAGNPGPKKNRGVLELTKNQTGGGTFAAA